MKNFTQQLKTAFLLSAFVLLAITVKAQNDYFIKMDGTKVNMYGEEMYDYGTTIQYKNEDGKRTNEKVKDIKILIYGGSIMMNLPTTPNSKKTSLNFIMAFNDKYVLTAKSFDGFNVYLNILDRNFNFVNKDKIFLPHGSRKGDIQKRKEIYNQEIVKYFKDCPSLHEVCFKNIENSNGVYNGINYYNCNNAPDLFTNKTVKSNEVNQDIVKEVEQKDFYVNIKGEKIEFTQYFQLLKLGEKFSYVDKSKTSNFGVTSTIKNEEIKYIFYDSKVYAPLQYQGKQYLMEIVAFSDNYTLTCVYKFNYGTSMGKPLGDFMTSFLVFDRKTNTILTEVKVDEPIKPVLEKYFGSCKVNLNSLFEDNKKNHRGILFGFSYINCGNAKEFIEGIKFE